MLMKMRSRMQKANNQKGFTLVELMVVVVILGILVAIAVPIYQNIQTNAEVSACKANQRSIEGAYQVYQADTNPGTWPGDYIAGATAAANVITLPDVPTASCAYTLDPSTGQVTCAVGAHN